MSNVRHIIYNDFVNRLLFLDSVDAIWRTLTSEPNIDVKLLYQSLMSLEKEYLDSKQPAQYELLHFVRAIVDNAFTSEVQTGSQLQSISTSEELIDHVLHTTDLLHAYRLLQKHRSLITEQLHSELRRQVLAPKRNLDVFRHGTAIIVLVCRLLGDPNKIAEAYLLWGASQRRVNLFKKAEHWIARAVRIAEVQNDPELIIWTLAAQAGLYDDMHDTERAAESYAKALRKAEDHGFEYMLMQLRGALAGCYRTLGRYSEALKLIESALNTAVPDNWDKIYDYHIQYKNLQGLLLDDLGRYDEAQARYEQAVELAEGRGDQRRQFVAMNNLAASFLKRGNAREAVSRYRDINRTVEQWGHPIMIASSQNNLGTALLQLGYPTEALLEFGKALEVKTAMDNPSGEALTYLNMGDALTELGKLDSARVCYDLALVLAIELLNRTGDTTMLMMCISRSHESDLDENTLGMARFAYDTAHQTGDILTELGIVPLLISDLKRRGQIDEAVQLYRETIARGQALDSLSPLLLRLQTGLARLLAQHEGVQEAYQLLTDALSTIDVQIQGVQLDERRGEIIDEWIQLYNALIELLFHYGNALALPGNLSASEWAFDLHESAKSRTFIASLADAVLAPPASVPHFLQEREARLLELERSLQNHTLRGGAASTTYRLNRLREVHAELDACWTEIAPFAPDYVRLRTGTPATLHAIQDILTRTASHSVALVSFFCTTNTTYCFVVRSDRKELQVFQCPVGQEKLNKVAQQLRRAFNGAPKEFPPYPPIRGDRPHNRNLRFFDDLSSDLLHFLPAVEGVEHLCIAPHGPLHLLPLHALRLPDGNFLVERFAVTYCPSASTISYVLGPRRPTIRDLYRRSVYVAGVASQEDAHPEFFEHDDVLFDQQFWDVTVETGPEMATQSQVLQRLGSYDVVHLTCHGYFDDRNPLNSGLVLADQQTRPPRDPQLVSPFHRWNFLLTARDILNTTMRAELVTLRACSTGIQGARNQGDEFDGLSRALLYAGNAAVVVSLWNVDQVSSQQLLARFYRYWTELERPNEKWRAFWMAQRDFLTATDAPLLAHPYHWAPLVLIGDWR